MAELFNTNTSITYVALAMNELGQAGAEAVAKALEVNKSLASLNLYANEIGPDGAAAVAKACGRRLERQARSDNTLWPLPPKILPFHYGVY